MFDATQTRAGRHLTAKVTVRMTETEYAQWRGSRVVLRGQPDPLADPAVLTLSQIAVMADRFVETVQRWAYDPTSGFPATRARGEVLCWLIETGRMDRELKPIGTATHPGPRVRRWVTAHLDEGT